MGFCEKSASNAELRNNPENFHPCHFEDSGSESEELQIATSPLNAPIESAALQDVKPMKLEILRQPSFGSTMKLLGGGMELQSLMRDEEFLLKQKEDGELGKLVAEQKKQNTKLISDSDFFENESRTVKSQDVMNIPDEINIKTLRKSKKKQQQQKKRKR